MALIALRTVLIYVTESPGASDQISLKPKPDSREMRVANRTVICMWIIPTVSPYDRLKLYRPCGLLAKVSALCTREPSVHDSATHVNSGIEVSSAHHGAYAVALSVSPKSYLTS